MQHNRPTAPYMRVLSNPSPALTRDQQQGLQRDRVNSLSAANAMAVSASTSAANANAVYAPLEPLASAVPASQQHPHQQQQHLGYPLIASGTRSHASMMSQGQSRQQTLASIPSRGSGGGDATSSSLFSSASIPSSPDSTQPNGAFTSSFSTHPVQHLPHPHAHQHQHQHQHQRVGFIRNISKASVSSVASQESVDSLASYLNYESVAPPSFPMVMGVPMGPSVGTGMGAGMSVPSNGAQSYYPLQPLSYNYPQQQQQTLQQHFAASSSSSASLSSSQPSVHSSTSQHRLTKSKSRSSGPSDEGSDDRDRQSVSPPALTPFLRFDSGSQHELRSTPPPPHDASRSSASVAEIRGSVTSSGSVSAAAQGQTATTGMPLARHLPPSEPAVTRMMTMPISSAAVFSRTNSAGINGDADAITVAASAAPSVRHSLIVSADGEDAWSALNGSRLKRESKSSSSTRPIVHQERNSEERVEIPLPSSPDVASPFKAQNPRLSQPTVEPAATFAHAGEPPAAASGAFAGIGALTPPSMEPSQSTVDQSELYTDEEEYSFDEDEDDDDSFERFSDDQADRDGLADVTADTTVGSTSTKANRNVASKEDAPWKRRPQAQKCQNKNITGEGGVSGTRVTDDGKLVKTRRRTRPQEAMILLEAFRKNQFPTGEEREKLALKLGLAPKAVTVWFQNRRQTEKKRLGDWQHAHALREPSTATAPTTDAVETHEPQEDSASERANQAETVQPTHETIVQPTRETSPSNLDTLRRGLWHMGQTTSAEQSSSEKSSSPNPSVKDIRSLIDAPHLRHNLAPRLECASLDDVVASHAANGEAISTRPSAGNNRLQATLEAAGGLQAILKRVRNSEMPGRTPDRDTKSRARTLAELKASLSASALREKHIGAPENLHSSISHGSIDDLFSGSSPRSDSPPPSVAQRVTSVVEAFRDADGSYQVRKNGFEDSRAKSFSPKTQSAKDAAMESNSQVAILRSSSEPRSVLRTVALQDDAYPRSLTTNFDLRVPSPVTDRTHNQKLLQLMQSSSNSSDEEGNLSGTELMSDEETSLRIIARRRAIKDAENIRGRSKTAKSGAFSARAALKELALKRRSKGLGSMRISLKSRMHVARNAGGATARPMLDLAAGRDRAESSSDDDTPLYRTCRGKSLRKSLVGRFNGLSRISSAPHPLHMGATMRQGSKRPREGENSSAPLAKRFAARPPLARLQSGPLRIESLRRSAQRSNTREAASDPISSDAEEDGRAFGLKQASATGRGRQTQRWMFASVSNGLMGPLSRSNSRESTRPQGTAQHLSSLATYHERARPSGEQDVANKPFISVPSVPSNGSFAPAAKRKAYGEYAQSESRGTAPLSRASPRKSNGLRTISTSMRSPKRSGSSSDVPEEDKENSSPVGPNYDDSALILDNGKSRVWMSHERSSSLHSPSKNRTRALNDQSDAQRRFTQLAERDRAAAEVLLGLGVSQ